MASHLDPVRTSHPKERGSLSRNPSRFTDYALHLFGRPLLSVQGTGGPRNTLVHQGSTKIVGSGRQRGNHAHLPHLAFPSVRSWLACAISAASGSSAAMVCSSSRVIRQTILFPNLFIPAATRTRPHLPLTCAVRLPPGCGVFIRDEPNRLLTSRPR